LDLATEARDDINKLGISMTPDQSCTPRGSTPRWRSHKELAGDTRPPGPNAQGAADAVMD
jgi:hypothetical protein